MSNLHALSELGQSVWYDNIRRSMIHSGEFKQLLDLGVQGVTSNPTIFEKAITGSGNYDEDIRTLAVEDDRPEAIYESLAIEDIGNAADLLRPIYDRTHGADGFACLEVNPTLAHDTEKTVAEARRLFAALGRPNVMIKVPATPAGIPAIQSLIGEGIPVNVTLIFALASYEAAAEAYLRGLETLLNNGGDPGRVASVASFFVSRVDTAVDAALEKIGNRLLQGNIAVANAKIAYDRFHHLVSGERWQGLAAQGARPQRLLWASTGTKNPEYPDTFYVDALIGAETVNTMPPETLEAFLDHGKAAPTLGENLSAARDRIAKLQRLGIDLDAVTRTLQDEGVASFARSFESLLDCIRQKRRQLLADNPVPSE